ncbi:MAG: helix-turn-helix domain-containing protein [Ruminococcus sp.]
MTLGEKIKSARKQSCLSQEQLSEKLGISRSAVAKWETDKGIPDIENLKALSRLLGVSIDYLLDNGENLDKSVIKEPIDLSKYDEGTRGKKKDRWVREKYPDAIINPLLAKKKLTRGQKILDNLLGIFTDAPFGTADAYNDLKNVDKQYYLVEQGDKHFLVLVTDEFIESREMAQKQHSKKFEIGDIKFTKCTYEVK